MPAADHATHSNIDTDYTAAGAGRPLPQSPATERYRLGDEIARGGMGIIYRAADTFLDREVAVKMLHEKFAPESGAALRFAGEARITGQLQHPAIPPVHDLGTLAEGRPFLAMKLIKGQTLEVALKDRPDPSAERGRLVAVFEQICQALAYAHAHNVIHRDLKPANVMVGAFGEVQVMDWGLAKVLGAGPSPASPTEAANEPTRAWTQISPTPELGPHTQAGSMLGTPAFAPPEQVAGEIDKVDRRADVFGLGAILAVILTGKPPYVGETAEAVRVQALRGKLDDCFARLAACNAEPELVALCRRCLAFEPADRPADAGAVAQAVAGLRAAADDRAKHAELRRARAEVEVKEQRRRRRLLLVVLAVVLAGIVGTTIGLIWALRASHAESLQAQSEKEAKEREKEAKVKAELDRDLARKHFKTVLETYHQMVDSIQRKLEVRPGTQYVRKELLENARAGLLKLREEADAQGNPDTTLVWSYYRMGDVELALGNTPAAQREYQAGLELAQRLADADPHNAAAMRVLSMSYHKLGYVSLHLGQTKEAFAFWQKSLQVAQCRADADPNNVEPQRDLCVSYQLLGNAAMEMGQTKDALDYFQKSLQASQRLAEADPKDGEAQRALSVISNKVGDVTVRLGQAKDALNFYQKGLEIAQRLAEADPKNVVAQRDLSISYNKVGDVSLQLGQTKDALDFYQKSLQVRLPLVETDPRNAELQRDLSINYNKLGDVVLEMGQSQDAFDFFQKALQIRLRLAETDPKNAQAQRDLSFSYDRVGNTAMKLGQTKDALDLYQKYYQIAARLAEADPKNTEGQRVLSVSYDHLGNVSLQLGQTKDALAFSQKSLQIRQRLAEADPKNAQAHRNLADSYGLLGNVYLTMMEFAEAAKWYEKMIAYVNSWPDPKALNLPLRSAETGLAVCQNAEQAIGDIEFIFTQKPKLVPELLAIRVKALLQRKQPADATATAERFAEWAEKQEKDRNDQLWNAARAFALCAAASDKPDALVGQALVLLGKAKAGGYFTPPRIAYMNYGADFDGIRQHPRYVEFVKELGPKK